MIVGLPGAIAIPWIRTSPFPAITPAVMSRSSLELPPERSTTSHSGKCSGDHRLEGLAFVLYDPIESWYAPVFRKPRCEHRCIGIPDLPRPGYGSDRHQLVAGRDDPDNGFFCNRDHRTAARREHPGILRGEPRARAEDDLAFFKILVPQQDILTMGNRFFDQDCIAGLLGIFHHHGCIGTFRQDAPGRDVDALPVPDDRSLSCSFPSPPVPHALEQGGYGVTCPGRIRRADRVPVHYRAVEPGDIGVCCNGCSQHPACGLLYRNCFCCCSRGNLLQRRLTASATATTCKKPAHLKQPG